MKKTSKQPRGQAHTDSERIGIFVRAGLPALVVWMFLVSSAQPRDDICVKVGALRTFYLFGSGKVQKHELLMR